MWALTLTLSLVAAAAQQSAIERQADRYAFDTVASAARSKPAVDVVKLDCGFRRLAVMKNCRLLFICGVHNDDRGD